MFNLKQRKGADLSQAAAQEAAFKTGNLGNLAALTQNRYAQTGGTAVQSGIGLDTLFSVGGTAAAA